MIIELGLASEATKGSLPNGRDEVSITPPFADCVTKSLTGAPGC